MKMRFWQKTYVFTLILFLLCLNLGIMSLAVYTHEKTVKNAEEAAKAEHYYVALSFERDYGFLDESSSPVLLMQSYGNHYKGERYICFMSEDEVVYTNFTSDYVIEKNSLKHVEMHEERHILISSEICDGEYTFIYGKNYSYIDTEFESLMVIYLVTATSVSAVLAVCLYFILKRLSLPLEKLKQTTDSIEKGDFDVRAEEKGSDEFTSLAKSFNSMLLKINEQIDVLEQDGKIKQMLVDNMAHEMRTPLTSIYGYAETLEKTSMNEEKRITAAKYIMSEAKRLQKISEILLDGAFVRENKIEMTETELSGIIKDVVEKLLLKAEEYGVSISSHVDEMKIKGNETLLSMLFYNLVENAIKACGENGSVRVYGVENKIIVEDNGKGMTEEQVSHVTEPFYRTDKSRSRAEGGAGLGLALCKTIAQSHALELIFESELNVGTKIIIDFTTLKQD